MVESWHANQIGAVLLIFSLNQVCLCLFDDS